MKEAFSGGQNGRFIPAPRIFYNLFRKDDRPKEDKSWLDRVTDSIIDKLELRWEDDEEARMEVKFVDHDHHQLFLHGFLVSPVCRLSPNLFSIETVLEDSPSLGDTASTTSRPAC